MNIVVCVLDNLAYKLNANGKNPALVSYNETIYLFELLEKLDKIREHSDTISIIVSEKLSFLDCFLRKRKNMELILNTSFYEKLDTLKQELCMFLYADEKISERDIENFYRFCKTDWKGNLKLAKSSEEQMMGYNWEQNKKKMAVGMFGCTPSFMHTCTNEDLHDFCDSLQMKCIEYKADIQYYCMKDVSYKLIQKEVIAFLYEKVDFPMNLTVSKLFERTVNKFPDKIAVSCLGQSITYQELDNITDQIAINILKVKGEKTKNSVGILLNRSINYVASMIGILKAGLTYVPMSVLYPEGRLNMIYEAADLLCIITSYEIEYFKQNVSRCVLYEDIVKKAEEGIAKLEKIDFDSSQIAYIMFTSGSTGEPKGVKISHRNIVNNAFYLHRKVFENKSIVPEKYGVIAEFIFDMSVQQIYPALLFGKELKIYANEKSPKKMIEFLNTVDTMDATPILLELITDYLEHNQTVFLHNVHLVVGGEKLQHKLCSRYFAIQKEQEITNIYGPTECTVEVTTFYLNKKIVDSLDSIPIGYAVDNSRIYVLDQENKFLIPNQIGEICVSGECVGHGYVNSPKLTSEVYVGDVLKNETMYKTGDYGYWNEDGILCYIGRKDRQIKVRGYRIDLGDIENTLVNHLPFKEVRVFYTDVEELGKKLVAYFISEKQEVTLAEIMNSIKGFLPEYMFPSFFVPVESFSLNISGKLDKSKLPEIVTNALKEENESCLIYTADNLISKKLINYILSNYTSYDQDIIGISLRALGFDSIGLLRMLSYISNEIGVEISITNISLKMKVYELIELVKKNEGNKEIYNKEKKKGKRYKKSYPCLPMQNYIWDLEIESRELEGKYSNMNLMLYMWKIRECIDIGRLKEAVFHVVSNHDAFFMKFTYAKNNSKAIYTTETKITVEEYKVSNLEQETILKCIPEYDARMTPLAHFAIVNYNEEKYLLITAHHLIFDYFSCISFLENVEQYYFNGTCNESSFFQNLLQLHRKRNDIPAQVTQKLKQYYAQTKSVNFNLNYNKSSVKMEKLTIMIPEQVIYKVRAYAVEHIFSEFNIYMHAFLKVLCHLTKQEDVTVGTFINGRSEVFPIDTIGFFSEYIPFHYHDNKEECCKDIEKIEKKMQELQRMDNGVYMYEIMQNMQEPCNVLFDYEKLYRIEKENTVFEYGDTYEFVQISYDLVLRIYDQQEKTKVVIEYKNLMGKAYAHQIFEQFVKYLDENLI